MKIRFAVLCFVVLASAMAAGAQNKISGTVTCAKPDPQTALPVGDRDGHAFVVMKQKCTWTKPVEIAGQQAKTGEDTLFSEMDGGKGRDSGFDVTTMSGGDTFVVHFSGSSAADKNGKLQTQTGSWSFVRGSGKLKGITGKGTYKGAGNADGGSTTEVEGEYQIGPGR
jgi:hypothetical protein